MLPERRRKQKGEGDGSLGVRLWDIGGTVPCYMGFLCQKKRPWSLLNLPCNKDSMPLALVSIAGA